MGIMTERDGRLHGSTVHLAVTFMKICIVSVDVQTYDEQEKEIQ